MITSGDTVAVDVASVAKDSSVKYPLYIDPDWTAGNLNAWSINKTYPNTSYLNVPEDSDGRGNQVVGYLQPGWTAPHSGDGLAQLGISFWQMSTAAVANKQIIEAHFNTYESWSASCNATGVQLYRTTNPGAGSTWNQSGGVQYFGASNSSSDWPNNPLDTQYAAKADYCGGSGPLGFNATAGVAAIAQAGQPEIVLALRAQHEDDTYSWKRFNLGATLQIKFNSRPNTPTNAGFSAPPRGCSTSSSSPTYINPRASLRMYATFTDPDPDNIYAKFRIVQASNGSINVITPITVGPIAQGVVQNPSDIVLNQEGFFAMVVTTQDGAGATSGDLICYFVADWTAPGLPTVPTGTLNGTVGHALSVPVTTNPVDHVARLEYWWTLPASAPTSTTEVPVVAFTDVLPACGSTAGIVQFACPDGTNHFTLSTAPVDQTSTLHVATIDAAGNTSLNADQTVASSPVSVYSGPDGDMTYTKGHGWMGPDFSSTMTVPSSLPDRNSSSSTSMYTKKLAEIPGSGYVGTPTVTGLGQEVDSVQAVTFPGYAALDRVVGSQHMAVLEGTMPAGFHVESMVGHILADYPGAAPANMHKIFSCIQTGGDEFTTRYGPCEGVSGTSVMLGWLWNTEAAAPAQHKTIYRCSVTASGDHFDSNLANCEGQHYDYILGYAADIQAVQTNDTFVDPQGHSFNGPAVDTTKSYTVSAWVKPNTTATGMYHTIASQGGSTSAGFYLQTTPSGQYRFCVRSQATLATDCAESPANVVNGDWKFVTGIWDSVNHQARLLLNGDINPAAVHRHSTPSGETSANGTLSIGSSVTNGCRTNMWDGLISDVTIFPGVVNTGQLDNLKNHSTP